MRRNFREGYLEEYRLLEPRALRYRKEDVNRLIDFMPGLRFFSGHCISADLPYERADIEVVGIAAVRDPLERILSWYAYNRNSHRYDNLEKIQDLGTYLESAITDYDFASDPWRWSQVADLVDLQGEKGLERIAELVEGRKLFLFPLSRFDEMLCFLERRWPEDFVDCAYARRENVSIHDQPLTAEIEEKLRRLGALRPIAEDRALLEMAQDQLTEGLMAELGGAANVTDYLAGFRRRCRRASRVERRLRSPLRRVRRWLAPTLFLA